MAKRKQPKAWIPTQQVSEIGRDGVKIINDRLIGRYSEVFESCLIDGCQITIPDEEPSYAEKRCYRYGKTEGCGEGNDENKMLVHCNGSAVNEKDGLYVHSICGEEGGKEKELEEEFCIEQANAGSQPRAVMVKTEDAYVACCAMMNSLVLWCVTSGATIGVGGIFGIGNGVGVD